MKSEDFNHLVEGENKNSVSLLCHKAEEYAGDTDRLENFKRAAALLGCSPAKALIGMLAKHFVSIVMMVERPKDFTMSHWNEKLTDIRNYTYLLKATLLDMSEEEQ